MDDESVISWVNALEGASPNILETTPEPTSRNSAEIAAPNTDRKRKIASNHNATNSLLGYTMTNENVEMKDGHLGSDEKAFDPAAPRPRARSIPGSSASFPISQANSLSSSSSRTSLVKRQMMRLRLQDKGIDYQPLNETTYCFKSEDDPADDLPGQIPSLDDIKNVLAMATECERYNHEEASWNAEVYLRLLHGIFGTPIGKQYSNFNAMVCTTARPHADFQPIMSISKMIDLCVYASYDQSIEVDAVTKFCRTAPTLSINHTNFEPLQLSPLILSIATGKHDAESDKTQLQIGIWHAAQWNFLQWAVHEKLLQQHQEKDGHTPLTTDEEDDIRAKTLTALSKLSFIPGIIIQGNYWKLVISTYAEGKTKLFSGFVFGKTESLMDIYAIVAGVRELTAWGRDTYLPWFKENILTIE
ncbi:hypothetical protein V8C44DRAFT_348959 [Trichoderma aethiopicum]